MPIATTQTDPKNLTNTSAHHQPQVSTELHQDSNTDHSLNNGVVVDTDHDRELVGSSSDGRETTVIATTNS